MMYEISKFEAWDIDEEIDVKIVQSLIKSNK